MPAQSIDWFRTIIFMFHFAGACIITFGILLRCNQTMFSSRVYVDSAYREPGLLPFLLDETAALSSTCFRNDSDTELCSRQGLPVFEKRINYLGWHVFVLLAYFEWVSSAFAFLYIRRKPGNRSWMISIFLVIVGTLLCMPWSMTVYVNEILFIGYSTVACIIVFYAVRKQCNTYENEDVVYSAVSQDPSPMPSAPSLPESTQYGGMPPNVPGWNQDGAKAKSGNSPEWIPDVTKPKSGNSPGLNPDVSKTKPNNSPPYSWWSMWGLTYTKSQAGYASVESGHQGRFLKIPSNFGSYSSVRGTPFRLSTESHLGVAQNATEAYAPILRFTEYSITASFLFVGVLCIFAPDVPAFMSFLGYYCICSCNVLGVLSHYGLLLHNGVKNSTWLKTETRVRRRDRFSFLNVRLNGFGDEKLKGGDSSTSQDAIPTALLIPQSGSTANGEAAPSDAQQLQAAKNYLLDLDLFHSWVAYVSALVIILYQGNLLTSNRVPWFVVFSAWMLLLSYSSFGIWATLAYKLPSLLRAKWLHTLCMVASGDIGQILVKGLDILSLAAKISIVMSLSTGFVFQGDGVCQVG